MSLDSEAMKRLFADRWPTTVRLALLLGANDPEDLAAEAFARVYLRRANVRSIEAAASYLNRAVVNLVRDRGRRAILENRRIGQRLDQPEAAPIIFSFDAAVVKAVSSLPDRQREAIVLRYWLDLSERSSAMAMNISAGAVKTHVFRGLATLRITLKGMHDER